MATISELFTRYSTILPVHTPALLPLKFVTGNIIDCSPDSILYYAYWKPQKKSMTMEKIHNIFSAFSEDSIMTSLSTLLTLGYITVDAESNTYTLR